MKFETPHHVVTHITIPAKDHFESGKTLRNNLLSVRRNAAMSFGDETLLEGDNRALASLSSNGQQTTHASNSNGRIWQVNFSRMAPLKQG